MEDPILNRSIEETKELAARWSQFHDFFRMGVKGENLTPQAEMKFLEVKMRVAMLHGSFMKSVKHDQKVAQNIISVMAACILLKRLKGMNATELQKLEYEWNEAYLLISDTISHLEEEREALLPVSERVHKLNQMRVGATKTTLKFLKNPIFITVFVLATLSSVLIGAPVLGFYDITHTKKDFPFTRRFYNPTMNALRKYFPEIPFTDMEEFPVVNHAFAQADPSQRAVLFSRVGEEAIRELTNRGFALEDVPAIFEIYQRRRTHETKVFFAPGDKRIIEHRLLFENAEDARKILELRKANMENNLSQEEAYNINANVTFCRRANMIILLELSTPDYRATYAREKFGMREDEIGV